MVIDCTSHGDDHLFFLMRVEDNVMVYQVSLREADTVGQNKFRQPVKPCEVYSPARVDTERLLKGITGTTIQERPRGK